jgi:hypothetical protein
MSNENHPFGVVDAALPEAGYLRHRRSRQMFFSQVDFLTDAFNDAISNSAQTAALGVTAGTLLSLADDGKNKGQGVENSLKAVTKMSLMGMLF